MLSRIPESELVSLLTGYGHTPFVVSGDDPADVHRQLADTLDAMLDAVAEYQDAARSGGDTSRPPWPMLVLRTPKGWTGPAVVDGQQVEGTWRSHQVPLSGVRDNDEHLKMLEAWMRSYKPEELFDESGRILDSVARLAPAGERRMGATPQANGGRNAAPLDLPDFRDYALDVPRPDGNRAGANGVMANWLKDVVVRNPTSFRVMGPDETVSNRLGALLEVTDRAWQAEIIEGDDHLAPGGRVMEVLSEHLCQGWLEGYNLTGRHGIFNCYEAFIHIVDSMFNQHAKWLKVTQKLGWRRSIPSLNYLLSSLVWRQDHNGFSHQDPGFLNHVATKKPEVVRIYLPPDANTLLSTVDHCLRSRDYINVIVSEKYEAPNWLDIDAAVSHCTLGAGRWGFASTDGEGREPDVVLACSGNQPTLEAMAAADLLRQHLPDLKVRFVNVVDLMRLQPAHRAPPRDDQQGLRRPVHDRQAGDLRLARLPVAHPPVHATGATTTTTSTCGATRRRARPPRPSTW